MLSSEDKHRIVFALGYTGGVLDSSSVNYNSIVNDRLNNLSQYTEERAVSLVTKIEGVKDHLESNMSKNNVKQIDDIVLDTKLGDDLTKKELKRLLRELAQVLDIPNKATFSSVCVVC